MTEYYLICGSSVFSVTAPLAAGLFGYRYLNRELRLLAFFFLFTAIMDGSAFYQAIMGRNYNFLQYIYTPIAYSILAYVLSIWQTDVRFKRILIFSIPLFIAICLVDILFHMKFLRINDFAQSAADIILVFFSTITLISLSRRDAGSIHTDYRFWMLTAILLYSAGSLGYFAMHNLIETNRLIIAWYVHIGVNILANFTYAIGFLCRYRRQ